MIYAPRGIGKTFLALSIAYAVATGTSLLGWKAPKAKRVLYIDGEMTAKMPQDRLRILYQSNPSSQAVIPLQILTHDLISQANAKEKTSPDMPDFATIEGQQSIDYLVDSFDLCIIDNISTLCRKTKENEADSWEIVQRWALKMRSFGKAILFIHHAGKNGKQRGTSRREDILDSVISLKTAEFPNQSQGAAFDLKFEKTRGFYGESAKGFFVQLCMTPDGKQEWIKEGLKPNNEDIIKELYQKGLTQKQVVEKTGISKSTVSRHWPRKHNMVAT